MTETTSRANDRQVAGDHYRTGGDQHWDVCSRHDAGYLEGQISKYVLRWRRKNGLQDLQKAQHFCEKLREMVTGAMMDHEAGGRVPLHAIREFCALNEVPETEALICECVLGWRGRTAAITTAALLIDKLISEESSRDLVEGVLLSTPEGVLVAEGTPVSVVTDTETETMREHVHRETEQKIGAADRDALSRLRVPRGGEPTTILETGADTGEAVETTNYSGLVCRTVKRRGMRSGTRHDLTLEDACIHSTQVFWPVRISAEARIQMSCVPEEKVVHGTMEGTLAADLYSWDAGERLFVMREEYQSEYGDSSIVPLPSEVERHQVTLTHAEWSHIRGREIEHGPMRGRCWDALYTWSPSAEFHVMDARYQEDYGR